MSFAVVPDDNVGRPDFESKWKCKMKKEVSLALFLALLPFYSVVLAKRQPCCFNCSPPLINFTYSTYLPVFQVIFVNITIKITVLLQ